MEKLPDTTVRLLHRTPGVIGRKMNGGFYVGFAAKIRKYKLTGRHAREDPRRRPETCFARLVRAVRTGAVCACTYYRRCYYYYY